MRNSAKVVLSGKFRVINAYIKKIERSLAVESSLLPSKDRSDLVFPADVQSLSQGRQNARKGRERKMGMLAFSRLWNPGSITQGDLK